MRISNAILLLCLAVYQHGAQAGSLRATKQAEQEAIAERKLSSMPVVNNPPGTAFKVIEGKMNEVFNKNCGALLQPGGITEVRCANSRGASAIFSAERGSSLRPKSLQVCTSRSSSSCKTLDLSKPDGRQIMKEVDQALSVVRSRSRQLSRQSGTVYVPPGTAFRAIYDLMGAKFDYDCEELAYTNGNSRIHCTNPKGASATLEANSHPWPLSLKVCTSRRSSSCKTLDLSRPAGREIMREVRDALSVIR